MSNPRLPKRGELPSNGSLQRRTAVRGRRRGSSSNPTHLASRAYGAESSGTSRGDQPLNPTSFIDNADPPSQSGLSTSRHSPNTTADKSLLLEGVLIPPNLLGLEGAVCRHDFASGSDGGKRALEPDKMEILDEWRNKPDLCLTDMWDNFYKAGVESRNTGTLSPDVQTKLNGTARESVVVLHDALSYAESVPGTEWATKIMTYVQDFHAGYKDYWTHLGSEIKNDPEGKEWKRQLGEKTMVFCSSIAGILRHPKPTATSTAADTQPSGSPSSSRTAQRRELSPGARTRLKELRREVDQRPSTVPDDWVPSPVNTSPPSFPW